MNKNKDKDKNKNGHTRLSVVLILIGAVFVPVLINLIVTFAESNGYALYSSLSYAETITLLVSTSVAVMIACFQIRIENAIQKRNQEEKELQKDYNMKVLKGQRSTDGKIVDSYVHICYNFNLVACRRRHRILFYRLKELMGDSNPGFVIAIEGNDNLCGKLYPPYMELEEDEGVSVVVNGIPLSNVGDYIFDGECIFLLLSRINMKKHSGNDGGSKKECSDFDAFFYYPAVSYTGLRPYIHADITFKGKDSVFKDETDGNYNEPLKLEFTVKYDLYPDGGYSSDGTFMSKMANVGLKGE